MFDYKILKSENLLNRNCLMLSEMYFVYLNQNNKPRWLYKAKELINKKIFLLDLNEDFLKGIFSAVYETKKANENLQTLTFRELMKGGYFLIENRSVKEFYYSTLLFDSSKEFSSKEKEKYTKLLSVDFDNSIANHQLVSESWLDQPEIKRNICMKCSYENSYIDYDPEYICYGCKAGY